MQTISPFTKSYKTLYILNALRLVCVVLVGLSYGLRNLEYLRAAIVLFAFSQLILSSYELRNEVSMGKGGIIHGKVAKAFAIINPLFFGIIAYYLWDIKF